MNMTGQRTAIKTIDVALQTIDKQRLNATKMASTFCSNPFSSSVLGNQSEALYSKCAFRVANNKRVGENRVRS